MRVLDGKVSVQELVREVARYFDGIYFNDLTHAETKIVKAMPDLLTLEDDGQFNTCERLVVSLTDFAKQYLK